NRTAVQEAGLQGGQLLRLGAVEMLFELDADGTVTPGTPPTATPTIASAPPAAGGLKISSSAPVAAPPPPASGLRISGSKTAAVEATPPPMPVEASLAPPITGMPAIGQAICKFHPKSPSRWLCPKCGQQYCDLCVSTRATNAGTAHLCRPCAVECNPVNVKIDVAAIAKKTNFFAQLPGVFSYPFKHGGLFILICGTIFFAVVEFLSAFSWYLQAILIGYTFAYMQNVIHSTAAGDEGEPTLPNITNIVGDILVPCIRLIVIVALCFGPAIALAIWVPFGGGMAAVIEVRAAIGVGCIYFPMAFLAVAMFDSWTAINPLVVIPAIAKVPVHYMVAFIFLAIVVVVRWAGDAVLPLIIPVPVIPTVISSFIGLYFLTVNCRILGILYYCNKPKLGWFSR
ncbi:MAG: domain containing protein, partial [Pedosphaera sp.]|nr:domain containing protein [Pedosphaera sp.]